MQLTTRQKYNSKLQLQANCNNNLAYKLNKIKVPLYVLYSTNKQKRLYSTFFQFKAFAPSGVVFDYTKKANTIAALFGISKSKLDKQIPLLIKLGLVTKNGSRLNISGLQALNALHLDGNNKYCYIKIIAGQPLTVAFNTKIVYLSLINQSFLVNTYIKRFDNVCAVTAIGYQREYLQSQIECFKKGIDVPIQAPGNMDISLSLSAFADKLQLNSPAAALYWQRKLVAEGKIHVKNRLLTSKNYQPKQFRRLNGYYYYNTKTKLYCLQMANYVSIAN